MTYPPLEIGREYFWKRTNGWDWFGERRWWEVFVIASGLNGSGGYWLTELWRQNNSREVIRENVRTLSAEESSALERAVFEVEEVAS